MQWRDSAWVKWFPLALLAVPTLVFAGVILWSNAQPPCKRTEWRTVEVSGAKYSRGGTRSYEVCVDR